MPKRNPGTLKMGEEQGNAELLTVAQVGEMLGIHEWSVRSLVDRGDLRCIRPGKGKIAMIPRRAVEELLNGEKPNS